MPDTLQKLDYLTMHLRGFDHRGAAAALHSASETGFTISGVWKDSADFAVLVPYDADDPFGHPRWRYLPDFDFSGLTLKFDVAYTNLFPLDSPFFVDFTKADLLQVIKQDGSTATVKLFDHAKKVGGTFGVATGTFTFEDNGIQAFDRVTLWFRNLAFDHIVPNPPSGDPLGAAIDDIRDQINNRDWTSDGPFALRADRSGSSLTIKAARAGRVDASGTTVTWASGAKFPGVAGGSTIRINQVDYSVSTVDSPTQITLTASAGTQTNVLYMAERGGYDGNSIEMYSISKNDNLKTTEASVAFTGGDSATTWQVSLDFSALGITSVRQTWLTFAPRLIHSGAFTSEEFSAVFTNWGVTDAQSKRALKVMDLDTSVRVSARDQWAVYSGSGWSDISGFYEQGFARRTKTPGDQVTFTYHCQHTHDLYVGTSLYSDRGIFEVSLDGDAETDLDMYLDAEPAVVTRRKVRSGVAAGKHSLELTLKAGTGSIGYVDVIEAVVERSDVPAAPQVYTDVGVSTDFDTDATYKRAPAALVKAIEWSGFQGDVNHATLIYFHSERKRVGGSFPSATVTFGGTWADGDSAFLTIGGTTIGKSVFPADTNNTIAAHFSRFINETFSGVRASVSSNVVTITNRSPVFSFTLSTSKSSASGTISESGSLTGGVEGTWTVDEAASQVVNRAARDWHSDFFGQILSKGWTVVQALNMEMANPPDDPASGKVFTARYLDDEKVLTANVFGTLVGEQLAFSDNVLAYHKKEFLEFADLMNAAAVPVWLQIGEIGHWYFSNYNAATNADGGMAYYDDSTKAAAQAALGRPLHSFILPTDDPSVNASADANFLADRLKDHVAAIRTHVLGTHAGAKFELLWPADVNRNDSVLTGFAKVGGRLNRAVNMPTAWKQKSGSGFDRIKVEALAHGATDRDLAKAEEAIRIAYTEFSWAKADVRYLIGWFNGGAPWVEEYFIARLREQLPHVNWWAWDHLALLRWAAMPLPSERAWAWRRRLGRAA